jgi:hypothetical protein
MKQLFFLLLVFITRPSFAEPIVRLDNDSVQIKVFLPKVKIQSVKDLTLTLIVKSTQSRLLEIPKQGLWAYAKSGPGFFFIELQREEKGKFVDVPGIARIDSPPVANIDRLYKNETRNFPLPMRLLFHYTKGQYRIRVLVDFSTLNKLPDIYSDWFYFECENDLRFPK